MFKTYTPKTMLCGGFALSLLCAGCASNLPFYYTPVADPRCATFEASAKPQNKDYCRALTIKLLKQRYPGWQNIPNQ